MDRLDIRDKPDVMHSVAFERYYRAQKIVAESEFEELLRVLREPLPTCFRLLGSSLFNESAIQFIEECLKQPEVRAKLLPLEWLPGAYKFVCSRSDFRKLPELKALHRFVVDHGEAGALIRQEEVSMIPVQYLDVQSDSWILDMCAAPGSKTSQILERMGTHPTGVVVSNDSDSTRAHMLVHHVEQLASPALVVSCHEAQRFPMLLRGAEPVRFDSVLCDVPCSGDGTLRKSKIIWKSWSVRSGLSLHSLQRSILRRGLELLKVGGTLVYSTCSLNPLENEAVVASFLKTGVVEVVAVEQVLKARPGLMNWSVPVGGEMVERYSDVPPELLKKVKPTMFAPKVQMQQLERCQRYCPHDNNTGGFFVAVLRKVKDCAWLNPKSLEDVVTELRAAEGEDLSAAELENVSPSPEPTPSAPTTDETPISATPTSATPTSAAPTSGSGWMLVRPGTRALCPCPIEEHRVPVALGQCDFCLLATCCPCVREEHFRNTIGGYVKNGRPFQSPLFDNLVFRRDGHKKHWLVTDAVVELLQLRSRKPFKLIYAGSRLFELSSARSKDPALARRIAAMHAKLFANTFHGQLSPSRVARMSRTDLITLLRDGDETNRYPLDKLDLPNLTREASCLLVVGETDDPVLNKLGAVPAWVGKTQLEVLVKESMRKALIHLLLK
ncbi:MAG: uncharacterized protein KVP18_003793 [Porospora cf. gigantea A]|uniref:uncharacterized protein n=1 Tax=Porospora cf. gigantea A TaxID=2853593 RepID=UPI003559E817|nr:MAG: hypothetical protein KVP18_003793 [Porospora cf. gigantea A]